MGTSTTSYSRVKAMKYVPDSGEVVAGLCAITVTSSPNPNATLIKNVYVTTSAGVEKSSAASVTYSAVSGILYIANQGAFVLATDDVINLQLQFA